jgi:hypothetical protein
VQRGFVLLGGIHASSAANNAKRPPMVHDAEAAIAWYTAHVGFTVLLNAAFILWLDDLSCEVARMRAAGVRFRNDIVTGPAARKFF